MNNTSIIYLDWYEYLLWLFYVFSGAMVIYFVQSFNDNSNKYLIRGYFVKVFGGLIFAMVYVYYYPGGDTTEYYKASQKLIEILYQKPLIYFELLLSNSEDVAGILLKNNLSLHYFSASQEEWFMVRISSPLNFFGFNSYLGMTYFFSLLSFFGSNLLMKVMNNILPNKEKIIFRINFLIPGVLVWGSGVLKDTVTLLCFSILCFLLYKIVIKKMNLLKNLFMSIPPSIIIFELKPYILICFLAWVVITFFLQLMKNTSNQVAKFMIIPYLLIILSVGVYFSSFYILESTADYKSDKLLKKIEGFKSWHQELKGSAYSIGEMEYTQLGVLLKFPQAVNVSLFRPYLWEVNTLFSLLSGVESLFFLIFFLIILFSSKFKMLKYIFNEPYLGGALVFVLIFAFVIGVSAFNFGALVRFKIPLTAIFAFILFYSRIKHFQSKNLENNF